MGEQNYRERKCLLKMIALQKGINDVIFIN